MSRKKSSFPLLFILLLLAFEHAAVADERAEVVASWSSRESLLRDVVFEFNTVEFRPRGSLNGRRGHDPTAGDSPPTDISLTYRIRLSLSGELARFERHGESYHMNLRAARKMDKLVVKQADGEWRSLLIIPESADYPASMQHAPQGLIGTEATEFNQLSIMPVFLTCRANAKIALDKHSIDHDQGNTKVAWEKDGCREEYWIDSQRGNNVVRYRRTPKADRYTQLDIVYSQDPIVGWIPTSWRNAAYRNKCLYYRSETKVVSYDLAPEFARKEFLLDFPSGAVIRDIRDPNNGVAVE